MLSASYLVVDYPVPLDPLSHKREAIEALESKVENIASSRRKKEAYWGCNFSNDGRNKR